MTQKLLTSNLDTATLPPELAARAAEFHALRESDPKTFRTKLRNSTTLLEQAGGFTPLPWLLARMAGAEWSDTNANRWVMRIERYGHALRHAGYALRTSDDTGFQALRQAYCEYCESHGFEPSLGNGDHRATNREFWVLAKPPEIGLPDEISESGGGHTEGATMTVTVNRYERNKAARNECIEHFGGPRCQACGLDFEQRYGPLGRGFIHVHHLVPLARIGEAYEVNAKEDLIPLCPNCHAMAHRLDDPSDIARLRALIQDG